MTSVLTVPGIQRLLRTRETQVLYCPVHPGSFGHTQAYPLTYGDARADASRPGVMVCLDCFVEDIEYTPSKGLLIGDIVA